MSSPQCTSRRIILPSIPVLVYQMTVQAFDLIPTYTTDRVTRRRFQKCVIVMARHY